MPTKGSVVVLGFEEEEGLLLGLGDWGSSSSSPDSKPVASISRSMEE